MWKQTTTRLTLTYSLIFIIFLGAFSGGLYYWVYRSFSDGFTEQVRGQVEQNSATELSVQQSDTASTAAEIAVNNFRNILIIFDGGAFICVPFIAYFLTRRTLIPLKISQDKQQQFIANASHELRTPLAVISGELELALRRSHSIDEYKKTIYESKQEVDHMTQLTTDLLLLAQLDEIHDKAPETTTINLRDQLWHIKKSMAAMSKQKSVRVRITCPEDLVIIGNGRLIDVALSNVIRNAIKYSPNGKAVSITARQLTKNRASVAVHNQGSSIDSSHQSQLFDRFYQIKNDHSGEGFGLGLAIVKEIVTLHRGRISLTSSELGVTCTITI